MGSSSRPTRAAAKLSCSLPAAGPAFWMGSVSAGSRNSGNAKLQGSPLGRIKAHDSQTGAIALKAKPYNERFLLRPPHKQASSVLASREEAKQDLHRELPTFHWEKRERGCSLIDPLPPQAEDRAGRWVGTEATFLQWIQFPTACKGYFPPSPSWILSQASHSERKAETAFLNETTSHFAVF